jgi:prophage regulatory protein
MTLYKVPTRIMRLNEVKTITGLSRSTIYEKMAAKTFPLAIKLGSHSVGWVADEIQTWIDQLIMERDTTPEKQKEPDAVSGQ